MVFSRLTYDALAGRTPALPLILALDEDLFDATVVSAALGPGPALFERLITLLTTGPPDPGVEPARGSP